MAIHVRPGDDLRDIFFLVSVETDIEGASVIYFDPCVYGAIGDSACGQGGYM